MSSKEQHKNTSPLSTSCFVTLVVPECCRKSFNVRFPVILKYTINILANSSTENMFHFHILIKILSFESITVI